MRTLLLPVIEWCCVVAIGYTSYTFSGLLGLLVLVPTAALSVCLVLDGLTDKLRS